MRIPRTNRNGSDNCLTVGCIITASYNSEMDYTLIGNIFIVIHGKSVSYINTFRLPIIYIVNLKSYRYTVHLGNIGCNNINIIQ